MDPYLKKELIMEHYTNPLNRDTIDDPKYIQINSNSETCIDNLDIYVLFNPLISFIYFSILFLFFDIM